MDWLIKLFTDADSVAHIVLLYAEVISESIGLGRHKVCGLSLGFIIFLY